MGGVLVELFGGKPLYSNADPHTILFKVAVENVFPDMSYVLQAISPLLNFVSRSFYYYSTFVLFLSRWIKTENSLCR